MKRFFLYFSIALLTILVGCSDGDILSDLGGGKKIYYTTIDGKKVQFDAFSGSFDAVLVSNTYDKDQGCLTFDEKVTEIGDYAFFSCENLASITIPESIVSIGESVFDGCDNLSEFRGKYASKDNRCLVIDGCIVCFAAAGLKSYNIPDGITSIGYEAFSSCESLTSITIPDSVTSIGGWAFFYCESLTSITIPDSVTSIGNGVFSHCTSLTSITIPDSVTSIGNGAFSYCESLTSITIGDGVTSIGEGAFDDCESLTSITIPDSVTSIGEGAFEDCTSLTSVYCKATTPPTGGDDMFNHNDWDLKIYVPAESVDAYKDADVWRWYADDIVGYDFE